MAFICESKLINLWPSVVFFFILQAKSNPGTIRGDYCVHIGRNICHGSDSVESANKEIALWFKDDELVNWTPTEQQWIYE